MGKLKIFLKGLWEENPVFRLLLGMCPTLAVTGYLSNAIAMGLAVIFVLVCSSFTISSLRRFIPEEVRIPVFVVIIATFVTLADYYLRANFPVISKKLGPYVPLIVVNCIILGRQEAFASKNPVFLSVLDALGMGIGFSLALIILSSIREILGAGTILGIPILGSRFLPWLVLTLPPGAFLTLGALLGFIQFLEKRSK
ncbi:MAG TPA: electron transport complex subunit E [bacterium]|nr:electron transport complex subunit E [bacterium]HEX68564.1 electron transport complex subunit E [bacterium]